MVKLPCQDIKQIEQINKIAYSSLSVHLKYTIRIEMDRIQTKWKKLSWSRINIICLKKLNLILINLIFCQSFCILWPIMSRTASNRSHLHFDLWRITCGDNDVEDDDDGGAAVATNCNYNYFPSFICFFAAAAWGDLPFRRSTSTTYYKSFKIAFFPPWMGAILPSIKKNDAAFLSFSSDMTEHINGFDGWFRHRPVQFR